VAVLSAVRPGDRDHLAKREVVPMQAMDMMRTMDGMSMPDMDMKRMQDCIEACSACMQACTMCADQMAGMAEMGMCAGICMNCADMCDTMMRAMLRPMGMTAMLMTTMLQACMAMCEACMTECRTHADMSETCRMCADACETCMRACHDLMEAMSA
jgi:hypothetical protein